MNRWKINEKKCHYASIGNACKTCYSRFSVQIAATSENSLGVLYVSKYANVHLQCHPFFRDFSVYISQTSYALDGGVSFNRLPCLHRTAYPLALVAQTRGWKEVRVVDYTSHINEAGHIST
jgi:hypothetical protein